VKLLQLLIDTPVGAAFNLPSPIPALAGEEVQAFVVEHEDDNWTLACYWMGVSIGDVSASVQGKNLVLEQV
jgi:hypothetical protein